MSTYKVAEPTDTMSLTGILDMETGQTSMSAPGRKLPVTSGSFRPGAAGQESGN